MVASVHSANANANMGFLLASYSFLWRYRKWGNGYDDTLRTLTSKKKKRKEKHIGFAIFPRVYVFHLLRPLSVSAADFRKPGY